MSRKFILKSQNTRRTPMYAGRGVPAAFGVAKSPGGGVRGRRTSLVESSGQGSSASFFKQNRDNQESRNFLIGSTEARADWKKSQQRQGISIVIIILKSTNCYYYFKVY